MITIVKIITNQFIVDVGLFINLQGGKSDDTHIGFIYHYWRFIYGFITALQLSHCICLSNYVK
jgi:hypothetical protein